MLTYSTASFNSGTISRREISSSLATNRIIATTRKRRSGLPVAVSRCFASRSLSSKWPILLAQGKRVRFTCLQILSRLEPGSGSAAAEVLNLLGIWRGASFAVIHPKRALMSPAKEHPMAARLPASLRTREELSALIEGRAACRRQSVRRDSVATPLGGEHRLARACNGEVHSGAAVADFDHAPRPTHVERKMNRLAVP